MDFLLISTELIGIAIGSVLGPITSKRIPEVWLKRMFVMLAVYVGIGYLSKGFIGHSILPGNVGKSSQNLESKVRLAPAPSHLKPMYMPSDLFLGWTHT